MGRGRDDICGEYPHAVVSGPLLCGGGSRFNYRTYDVSPDGQRFLMIKEEVATNDSSIAPQIIVVQSWTEELKRLMPTN